jgi:hypothetical protein
MKANPKLIWRIGAGVTALVVIAVFLGWLSLQYRHYRQTVESAPLNAPLNVAIVSPAAGLQAPAGELLLVSARATGATALASLELWANGAIVGVEAAPSGGQAPFARLFHWTPTQPGTYALTARAVDGAGHTADSFSRIVVILPNEKAGPPAPAEPAAPAPPSGETGPAAPWPGSVGDWLAQVTVQTPPAAPELTVIADGCGAALTIHDLSNNEDGFFVDRQLPSLPQWQRLATLSGQAQFDYLAYSDSDQAGVLTYRVTAFNARGEAASNPAVAQVDSAQCPAQPGDQPVLFVQAVSLLSSTAADDAYCYKSLDGSHWLRWPTAGFFHPGQQGFDLSDPTIFSIVQGAADGQAPQKKMNLTLDCWGWVGGALANLGTLKFDGLGSDTLGPFELSAGMLAAKLLINLEPHYHTLDAHTDAPFKIPFDQYLLKPTVGTTLSIPKCQDHLAPDEKISYKTDYCVSAGYNSAASLYPFNPSFLIWNTIYQNQCAAGANCISPDNLQDWPELQGAEFGFNVYLFGGLGDPIFSTSKWRHTVYAPSPFLGGCGAKLQFSITSYVIPKDSQQMFESAPAWGVLPAPCPSGSYVTLDVALDNVKFSNLHEEPAEGQTLSMYGIMLAMPSWGDMPMLKLADYEASIPAACPPEGVAFDAAAAYGGHCPIKITPDFPYPFSLLPMCQATAIDTCSDSFQPGNNHIYFTLLHDGYWDQYLNYVQGDPFDVWVILADHDVHSPDDILCQAEIKVHKPLAEWAQAVNLIIPFEQPDNGTGACSGQLSVSAFDAAILP